MPEMGKFNFSKGVTVGSTGIYGIMYGIVIVINKTSKLTDKSSVQSLKGIILAR